VTTTVAMITAATTAVNTKAATINDGDARY